MIPVCRLSWLCKPIRHDCIPLYICEISAIKKNKYFLLFIYLLFCEIHKMFLKRKVFFSLLISVLFYSVRCRIFNRQTALHRNYFIYVWVYCAQKSKQPPQQSDFTFFFELVTLANNVCNSISAKRRPTHMRRPKPNGKLTKGCILWPECGHDAIFVVVLSAWVPSTSGIK